MGEARGCGQQKKVTLRRIATELRRLQERVEDLEDLRDLEEAIARTTEARAEPSHWVIV